MRTVLNFLIYSILISKSYIEAKSIILNDEINNTIEDGDDEDYIDLSHLDERAFRGPDEDVGKLLENLNNTSAANPEEVGTYFEGDILMTPGFGRSALSDKSKRWTGGVVPYVIDSGFGTAKKNEIYGQILINLNTFQLQIKSR